ncbi:helix-hairpin-helix domain-containing protein [Candidatus Venteria ishoeyi]|nr:OB-fold nucleic acid binding domain-containing protein [Candidatus Venteria ishoeyi]
MNGIKSIEDCKTGDKVLSRSSTGKSVYSTVVALHDHGLTPLWEIEFDDGTIEKCTLDHKWLTEYGQQPLWKILQMGSKVWGCAAYTAGDESASENLSSLRGREKEISLGGEMWRGATQKARYSCTSETMSGLYEYDSFGTFGRQSADNVLRPCHENAQESQRAFSAVRGMSKDSPGNSCTDMQGFRTHTRNAREIFADGETNISTSRDTGRTGATLENMARHTSRRISSNSSQSAWFSEVVQNGNMVRTPLNSTGFSSQYTNEVSARTQTNRLCTSAEENSHRSGWSLAFSAHQFRRTTTNSTSARSSLGSRDPASILALNPSFDDMFQRQLWRTYLSRTEPTARLDQRWQLGRDTVLRQPVRATFLGWRQSYDLEVDHPEHNFLLASGLCCSNSHSAAYALISYQTAWLKVHHPAAFMAAVLSSDMDNTDKVVGLIEECKAMKLEVRPPHVNSSEFKFSVSNAAPNVVFYGLGAIKGAGEAALEGIVQERLTQGNYTDIFDFCRRVDLKKCNRRVLESLIRAGALDKLDQQQDRAVLLASLDTALRMAEQHKTTIDSGQEDLFGMFGATQTSVPEKIAEHLPYAKGIAPWSDDIRLRGEKDTLGLYLTGHPINQYLPELAHFSRRLSKMSITGRGNTLKTAGLLIEKRERSTSRGKMAFLTLDDGSARLEAKLYSELCDSAQPLLIKDSILIVEGEVAEDEYNGGLSMTVKNLWDIAGIREQNATGLQLKLYENQAGQLPQLQETLKHFRPGQMPVSLQYYREDGIQARLKFSADWYIKPEQELLNQLFHLLGKEQVEILY